MKTYKIKDHLRYSLSVAQEKNCYSEEDCLKKLTDSEMCEHIRRWEKLMGAGRADSQDAHFLRARIYHNFLMRNLEIGAKNLAKFGSQRYADYAE